MGTPGLLGWIFSPKKEEIHQAAQEGKRILHSRWGTVFIFKSGAHIFFAWKAFILGFSTVLILVFLFLPRPQQSEKVPSIKQTENQ